MKFSKTYLAFMIIVCFLAIAINAYIIVHSCLNAIESSKASQGVVEVAENVVNTISPGTVTPENHDSFVMIIRKMFGHFGLFFISGLFSSLAFYLSLSVFKWAKHYLLVIISLSFGLAVAMLTEIIQLSVPGRSGEFTDVLIDFSGYLLGAILIGVVLFFVIHHLNKKNLAKQGDCTL